jgi:hypothetical protein
MGDCESPEGGREGKGGGERSIQEEGFSGGHRTLQQVSRGCMSVTWGVGACACVSGGVRCNDEYLACSVLDQTSPLLPLPISNH